jgi:hypothetical protein
MKFKVFSTFVFLLFMVNAYAVQPSNQVGDAIVSKPEIINTDSFLQAVLKDTVPPVKLSKPHSTKINSHHKAGNNRVNLSAIETPLVLIKSQNFDSTIHVTKVMDAKVQKVDSLLLLANPFLIELVYSGLPFDFNWNTTPDYRALYYGGKPATIADGLLKPIKTQTADETIDELRRVTRDEITRRATYLYVANFDELPDPGGYKNYVINDKKINKVKFIDDKDEFNRNQRRLVVRREHLGPWTHKANALAQFSESVISGNWYQGGNSNIAILGILSGQLNYDNKKNIQWENSAEWRIGFNSVAGDTLRMLSTNDDVVKINSKLGIKAGGNFFYSGSIDFSTQLFHSYNGVNSTVMKTSFLTPVRLNIGVGLDYKYKKIFSLMVSPVAYKYIYVSDNVHVNPNLFGVKKGENHLGEIGSSFKAILSYPLSREIQLDSKFSFYTNYQKVEIDWEMVCNLVINRFMSTRISFNPRYDNTVIGSKADVQFKQLISVGFSHKFN